MKTNKCDKWRVASGGTDAVGVGLSRHPSPVTRHSLAFTLIELLTVIAVIAVIAALIFPVASTVKQHAFIHNAQAQMSQIETAIEQYKSACGFYPPDNPGTVNNLNCVLTNQLYYELEGTRQTNNGMAYVTLDGVSQISTNNMAAAFGVSGFVNCNRPGADESVRQAQNFLPDLNTNQVGAITVGASPVNLLVTPIGGPDTAYNPLGQANSGMNPWRYAYPGTNNPGSYDLWVQLEIAGKTNLICNWTKTVQINSPLP
ncbi:MAG TPA: prepilin-type N-terminal cleavage/methylation domain-containing protein [Candidatus Sulfopaludibacter sp.]|nr:prepilin-type N-terminal cleavage/methylation domain-containing protein [Candidatus Sulfopaludibacter sp.]